MGRDQADRAWPWLIAGAALLIAGLAVIAYAWIDGGRVPLRTIVIPASPQVGVATGHAQASGR